MHTDVAKLSLDLELFNKKLAVNVENDTDDNSITTQFASVKQSFDNLLGQFNKVKTIVSENQVSPADVLQTNSTACECFDHINGFSSIVGKADFEHLLNGTFDTFDNLSLFKSRCFQLLSGVSILIKIKKSLRYVLPGDLSSLLLRHSEISIYRLNSKSTQ